MKDKPKKVELWNLGGRIISVKPEKVKALLSRGFIKVSGKQSHKHNPIFDRRDKNFAYGAPLKEVGFKEEKRVLKVIKI